MFYHVYNYNNKNILGEMAKLKISSEWWTSPTNSDNGKLVIVTGRADMTNVIDTHRYNDRVEITWKYTPEASGMPDLPTSKLMEQVTDAFNDMFDPDPIAVMTGIYTGDGERNWVFYVSSMRIFERKLNEALAPFELLPITLYAEVDPEWDEYKEMKEQSEILEGD